MIVAFDIDGTISRAPEFFALISRSLVDAGHRVLIITFREDEDDTRRLLSGWDIRYHELLLSSLEECARYGVDQWKAAVCRERGVDVFFEDDPDVLAHVDASTLCLMPVAPSPGEPGRTP